MSKVDKIYAPPGERVLDYKDYANLPVEECGEPLVPISGIAGVIATTIRGDAQPITGDLTYVRQGLLERLEVAARLVNIELPDSALDVGYGYRALSVQKTRFAGVLATLSSQYEGEKLIAAAHERVAVPEVAGHPAGAAVDIAIRQKGKLLDFGSNMWQFNSDAHTYSSNIKGDAAKNRYILRTCMQAAGFAPYFGEWWHFSYGDKEWAAYYNRPAALYEQVEFKTPSL